MSSKKGGLGKGAKQDGLSALFGENRENPDIPSPATKEPEGTPKQDRVAKHFMLDRKLAKQIKLYAVENEMKELAVIELALRRFLNDVEKS